METDPSGTAFPTDVSDDWAFVAPYLILVCPDALQRVPDPRGGQLRALDRPRRAA